MQLTRSVIERVGARPKKDQPQAVIIVEGRNLKLPSSSATERRFISNLEHAAKTIGKRPSKHPKKKLGDSRKKKKPRPGRGR